MSAQADAITAAASPSGGAAAPPFPFDIQQAGAKADPAGSPGPLFFIATGIAVASASFFDPRPALIVCTILLPLALGVWWLRRKITFQQAGLPYLYRLANFPSNVANVTTVQALLDPSMRPNCRHLVLAGRIGAGKTVSQSALRRNSRSEWVLAATPRW